MWESLFSREELERYKIYEKRKKGLDLPAGFIALRKMLQVIVKHRRNPTL